VTLFSSARLTTGTVSPFPISTVTPMSTDLAGVRRKSSETCANIMGKEFAAAATALMTWSGMPPVAVSRGTPRDRVIHGAETLNARKALGMVA
jgi:hypothetical protein